MPYCFYQFYSYDNKGFLNCLKKFAKDYAFKIATLLDLKNYLSKTDRLYYQNVLYGKAIIG